MKIIRNDKLIKRNAKISQYVLYVALATLVLGIYFTITKNTPGEIWLAYLFLIPAYVLVQISINLGNKWSRSPRPDEVVAASLKGLDNQYSLYIYTTPVPHVLVGPAGMWLIKTYHQTGNIFFDEKKNRIRHKGSGNFLSRLFSTDGIGNITKDSEPLIAKFKAYLDKSGIEEHPELQVVDLFISDEIEIDVPDYEEALLTTDKMKDFIRKTAKRVNVDPEVLKEITSKLPKE